MLANEIAAYLAANGIGIVGTSIFRWQMPDAPDECVCITPYAGEPPDLVGGIVNPGLQILVRSKTAAAAESKIWAIHDLLHTLANTTLNGTWYLLARAQQAPFPLGYDGQNRITLAQNFIIKKRR